jgi:DNA polymerase alpha subunit B
LLLPLLLSLLLLLLLSLLPQVVAVRGINPSGSCILVKQLWSHLPPPAAHKHHASTAAAAAGGGDVDAMDVDSVVGEVLGSSGGLSAVVAAGPFCLADDLGYEPLTDLLAALKDRPPNMLVRPGNGGWGGVGWGSGCGV